MDNKRQHSKKTSSSNPHPNKNRIPYIVLSGLTLLALLVFFNTQKTPSTNIPNRNLQNPPETKESHKTPETIKPSISLESSPKNDFTDGFTITTRLNVMSARRKGKKFNQEDVLEALKQPEMWKISRNEPENLLLSHEDMTDGRHFIETNPLRIESLMIGDKLPVNIPNIDTNFTLTVGSIEKHTGVVSWSGTLDEDDKGSFHIFSGDSLITGNINTEEGSFTFELKDGIGWTHSTGALVHFDPEVSDSPPTKEESTNPNQGDYHD